MKSVTALALLVALAAAPVAYAAPAAGASQPQPTIQKSSIERLRGGLIGTDGAALLSQLQNTLANECTAMGGMVSAYKTETIQRADGDVEVLVELDCSTS